MTNEKAALLFLHDSSAQQLTTTARRTIAAQHKSRKSAKYSEGHAVLQHSIAANDDAIKRGRGV